MNSYEILLDECYKQNIVVVEKNFKSKAKGLWKNNKIGISKKLLTIAEKKSVLSEELGHYYTTYGNILDQKNIANRKQEKRARNWAYEKSVRIIDLIACFKKELRTKNEIADYLNITEMFLEQAIQHYKEKYGIYYELDNYVIYFEPTLSILEMF
ncbi:hypothetical protein KYB31_04090 [Clostridium felsineum]|uniref:ImmA/IrrE family metallo-endopeptidase n=1 Tax=Clostridium felsineum TaxID=36839 RepID=UPI00214DC7B7|nr:ImmA/IrrE family metallo-endopeptidase [Clostridium felsineum]MCR3758178.1 hypothetical protein [Clostridium felsineum]